LAQIADADVVIVDFSGKNPNVYYEAGLADAWNKDWIILTQSADDLTFDVRHIRAIRYSNAMGADVKLRENLSQALEALGYGASSAGRAADTLNAPRTNRQGEISATIASPRDKRRRGFDPVKH
jgi:hypothetical protein